MFKLGAESGLGEGSSGDLSLRMPISRYFADTGDDLLVGQNDRLTLAPARDLAVKTVS